MTVHESAAHTNPKRERGASLADPLARASGSCRKIAHRDLAYRRVEHSLGSAPSIKCACQSQLTRFLMPISLSPAGMLCAVPQVMAADGAISKPLAKSGLAGWLIA